tara:strand:+ start:13 stop:1182 length:1170 start_codon:yes stop_codon:yes gene_type:complete
MAIKKINIGVVGSTGSVGKTSLKIFKKYKKQFNIELLACDQNLKEITSQIKTYSPKYVFVNNVNVYNSIKLKKFKKKIIFFNNFLYFQKKFKTKLDKVVLGVPGLVGLKFAFFFAKHSKEILVANKESLVCGASLLLKEAKNNNCKITSIDSEHFCIQQIIKNKSLDEIDSVFLTASGGPFLKKEEKSYSRATIKQVTNHPRWSMGSKISVDSATMCNKVLELIEAHVLFDIPVDKLKIKIHQESLVHSSIVFKNGLVHMIMHDTTMTIPIRNSIFENKFSNQKSNLFKSKKNIELNFDEIKLSKFKILKTGFKVLKMGHVSWILFNVINDNLVSKFLSKNFFFYQIVDNLVKIFNQKKIKAYCKITKIKTVADINKVISYGNALTDKL